MNLHVPYKWLILNSWANSDHFDELQEKLKLFSTAEIVVEKKNEVKRIVKWSKYYFFVVRKTY